MKYSLNVTAKCLTLSSILFIALLAQRATAMDDSFNSLPETKATDLRPIPEQDEFQRLSSSSTAEIAAAEAAAEAAAAATMVVTCPVCHGYTGWWLDYCHACGGDGKMDALTRGLYEVVTPNAQRCFDLFNNAREGSSYARAVLVAAIKYKLNYQPGKYKVICPSIVRTGVDRTSPLDYTYPSPDKMIKQQKRIFTDDIIDIQAVKVADGRIRGQLLLGECSVNCQSLYVKEMCRGRTKNDAGNCSVCGAKWKSGGWISLISLSKTWAEKTPTR
jgi:hypothetical protein